jgi:hypothetical protein
MTEEEKKQARKDYLKEYYKTDKYKAAVKGQRERYQRSEKSKAQQKTSNKEYKKTWRSKKLIRSVSPEEFDLILSLRATAED